MGHYLEDGNLLCDNCLTAVAPSDSFCSMCGHNLNMVCRSCGQFMEPLDKPIEYCPHCNMSTPELPREREQSHKRYKLDKSAALTAAAALVVEFEMDRVKMVDLLSGFNPAELGELEKHLDRLSLPSEITALKRFMEIARDIGCLQLVAIDRTTRDKTLGLLRTIDALDAELLDPRVEVYFDLAPEAAELRNGLKQLDPELYRAVMDYYASL